LKNLSGIAAILRFPLPDIDCDDSDEDDKGETALEPTTAD